MENKTLREWYNLLIPPYNELAIAAVESEGDFDLDITIAVDMADAINMFTWTSNPAPFGIGLKPWSYIYENTEQFMINPYAKYLKPNGAEVEVNTQKINT